MKIVKACNNKTPNSAITAVFRGFLWKLDFRSFVYRELNFTTELMMESQSSL